jgi:uncharacterized damage-inducible protein DinB
VRDLLVHIALSTWFADLVHKNRMTSMAEFTPDKWQELMADFTAESEKPRTKREIVDLLQSRGDEFAGFLEGLGDDFLAERVTMMPGTEPADKTRFELLLSAKEHEMHHRGQLMLIERIIGIVPHLTREMQERMARYQAAQTQR